MTIEPDLEETTDGLIPDRNGFVAWTVDLAPYGHRTLEFTCRLKKHKGVRGL